MKKRLRGICGPMECQIRISSSAPAVSSGFPDFYRGKVSIASYFLQKQSGPRLAVRSFLAFLMNSQIGNEILENSISIVYEDEDVLAVNKPSGLMTHPDGRNESRTLSDWAVEYSPEIRGVGEPLKLSNGSLIERHGIVHRLDRETSVIILLAKHQKAFEYLKIEFQE